MKYLLGTCVINELRKPLPQSVQKWFKRVDEDDFYLSVITIAELQDGIDRLPSSKKRNALENWFVSDVLQAFRDRILEIDLDVSLTWGRLSASMRKRGISKGIQDLYIASTAIFHGLTVITLNDKDFSPLEVATVNPWKL